MSNTIKLFWDPQGAELDQLADKKLVGEPSDGDTPYIRMPIRMLGIDTPETNLPGHASAVANNQKLADVATWLRAGGHGLPPGLVDHLAPRLDTGTAGVDHHQQGQDATQYFKSLLKTLLTKPDGKQRDVFVWTSRQPFDANKRLLAYLAPEYTRAERQLAQFQNRKTFNLLMLESGWAAPIIIYPNLFKNSDLRLARQAILSARAAQRGIWANPNTLLAYEFRACLKLWEKIQEQRQAGQAGRTLTIRVSDWLTRYCGDMCLQTIYEPQDYYQVPPENRFYVWPQDVRQAVADLNLMAG